MGRWITSRLYEGSRAIRLAQYAVLGVGGARALEALGVRPSVYHLNEGHPALAAFELLRQHLAAGARLGQRLGRGRGTAGLHHPYSGARWQRDVRRDEVMRMLGRIADSTGDPERFLSVGRVDTAEPRRALRA